MIARTSRAPLVLRLAAPLAWRGTRRIATKLLGFSATELGSALDMVRASELVDDPRLRRLFYRHGLDEFRHARRFREEADALAAECPELAVAARRHEAEHARRQDLLERWGLVRFVAFVHLSEARAEQQFHVLREHFAGHDRLHRLFDEVARDERHHATYSRQLLDEWRAAGRGAEVDRALRRVRLGELWASSRNTGRRVADLLARLVLCAVWLVAVPPFALLARLGGETGRAQAVGWHAPPAAPLTLEDLRRQGR